MKRLAWLVILLLLAVPCRADVDDFNATAAANINEANNVAAANIDDINAVTFSVLYCTDFTPGDPTDLICDDAEGDQTIGTSDYDTAQNGSNTWDSATIEGTNTIGEAAHGGSFSCGGKGSYAIEFHVDNSSSGNYQANLRENTTDGSTYYINFYAYIGSEAWEHNELLTIMNIFNNAGGVNLAYVGFEHHTTGGDHFHLFLGYMDSGWTNRVEEGTTVISTGTWYRIGLEFSRNTAAGAKIYLNGSLEKEGTYTTLDQDAGQVWAGSSDTSGSMEVNTDAITYQLDLIGVDNDTMPGACP